MNRRLRQMRIYLITSTKRKRVSPETHLLALRAGMNLPAARLTEEEIEEAFNAEECSFAEFHQMASRLRKAAEDA